MSSALWSGPSLAVGLLTVALAACSDTQHGQGMDEISMSDGGASDAQPDVRDAQGDVPDAQGDFPDAQADGGDGGDGGGDGGSREQPCGDVPPGGETRVRYRSEHVAAGAACEAEAQVRTCEDGVLTAWSGSFVFESCVAEGAPVCGELPDGGLESRLRYAHETVPSGESCQVELQTRTCDGGQLSAWTGSYAATECRVLDHRACGDVPHGGAESRVRYQESSVALGGQCVAEAQARTCSDGTLSPWSGTFIHGSCTVSGARSCGELPHGGVDARVRYREASVPFGQQCVWEIQTRRCTDGTLSQFDGEFVSETCSALAPPCGDGVRQETEACDDANLSAGDYCAPDCHAVTGRCGDLVRQSNEACDDGNERSEVSCPYGPGTCQTCSSDCQEVLSLVGPACGDGHVDSVEQCDDGNTAAGDGCSADCQQVETGFFCREEAGATFCRACGAPLYVDAARPSVGADGRSWTHAYSSLVVGMAEAARSVQEGGCEALHVWIADGVYKPTEDGSRGRSFELSEGVSLHGGFEGDEVSLAEREPPTWTRVVESVLSGDLQGDDNGSDEKRVDNSWHVVRGYNISERTVLDRVVIESGDTNGAPSDVESSNGAGLYLKDTHIELSDVTIRNNHGGLGGGGAYVTGGAPTFRRGNVSDNVVSGWVGKGAGLYFVWSNARVLGTSIYGNEASEGGGIAVYGGSVTLDDMNIGSNEGYIGGGLWVDGNGSWSHGRSGGWGTPVVIGTRLSISNNRGGQGAGIHVEGGDVLISSSLITDNHAEAHGGGISAESDRATLVNVTFAGNTAQGTGAAVRTDGGNVDLYNSLLWGRIAAGSAKLVYNHDPWGGTHFTYTWVDTDSHPAEEFWTPWSGAGFLDDGDNEYLPIDVGDVDADGDRAERMPLDRYGQPRVSGERVDLGGLEYQRESQ